MDVGHLAPEIALVLGAVVVVLVASFTRRDHQWITTPVASLAVVASAGISIGLARGADQQLSFDRAWALDGATQGAELIICGVTLTCLLLSVEWFRTDPRRGEYPAVMLFSAAGAMVLAGAADTMEIVVGMLLVSVTGYTLAAYHRASPAAVEAGMRYFLIGALTNAVLLIGVVILYGSTGTTNLADTATALAAGADPVAMVAVVVCLVVGLGFEIGAVPAHVWVPDVAQASPAPSAAFLTVVPKVGALVALARVLQVLPEDVVAWRPLIAVLAAATMTVGNLLALWQDDLRRMLGWSSVSQAGYALMAVVVIDRADMALPSLMIFLAAYAAATTAGFAVVTELRGRTALADYRGLGASHPWLAVALIVSLLSLVGIPPLGGFVGKLTLFTATIDGGYGWLAALAVANTVASLFYYLRVIAPMAFDTSSRRVPVLGRWAVGAVAVATAATVAVGLLAGPLLAALDGALLLP
ncbi:MAG: NADH-quinone oxidoreductase subunit N [Iamia sp.]